MDWWCVGGGFIGYCIGAFIVGAVKGLWAARNDGTSDV